MQQQVCQMTKLGREDPRLSAGLIRRVVFWVLVGLIFYAWGSYKSAEKRSHLAFQKIKAKPGYSDQPWAEFIRQIQAVSHKVARR